MFLLCLDGTGQVRDFVQEQASKQQSALFPACLQKP